jgi:hypothetical protein
MPQKVVTCECGVKIPITSDLAAMQQAIEAHANTHLKINFDCSKTSAANEGEATLEVSRIKEALMKKVLEMM